MDTLEERYDLALRALCCYEYRCLNDCARTGKQASPRLFMHDEIDTCIALESQYKTSSFATQHLEYATAEPYDILTSLRISLHRQHYTFQTAG